MASKPAAALPPGFRTLRGPMLSGRVVGGGWPTAAGQFQMPTSRRVPVFAEDEEAAEAPKQGFGKGLKREEEPEQFWQSEAEKTGYVTKIFKDPVAVLAFGAIL